MPQTPGLPERRAGGVNLGNGWPIVGWSALAIAAMTATSFDRSAAWLGPRRWKRLHTTGVYYIWIIFFVSYVPRVLESALYWPFALGLAAAMGLRLAGPALARRSRAGAKEEWEAREFISRADAHREAQPSGGKTEL